MARSVLCLVPAICVGVALLGRAQQPSASQPAKDSQPASARPANSAETLRASTQLVVVDVVVQDSGGQPIHGLTRDNFVLTEQKRPQTIRNFEEHTAASAKKPGPQMPPQPPGVFSNYLPVAPDSTLNILLIDALNTPMTDQLFVRKQLLDFVKHQKAGTDIAIFGLTNRLIMLQGFTADPAILRTAADRLNAKASSLLDNAVGGGAAPEKLSEAMADTAMSSGGASVAEAIASLQQFDAEQKASQVGLRTQYTLDAFNSLAHYLSNFSGRKNLIWLSGSFPLQIAPDPTVGDPFAVMNDFSPELRETVSLLSRAQVAVYPMDARGLMTEPMLNAANPGQSYTRNASAFNNDLMAFDRSQAAEHATMSRMADDTGGQAFYNSNGLADAVAKAIDEGANYYTLTYNPTDHNWNGSYRNIHVELAANAAARGFKIAYRRGYYADAALTPAMIANHAAEAYSQAAISRGAPEPQDILFKVRVLPLTGRSEDAVAPENHVNPNGKMKAPYRTYAVDYVALPGNFSLAPQSDGQRSGAIEFGVYVYDIEGNLLNISDKKVFMNLNPDLYKRFESSPVRFQLQVSAPAKEQSFMRVIIHDLPSNHYGVVEISSSEVVHLPALEAQNAPSKGAAEPTGAESQPTGKQ